MIISLIPRLRVFVASLAPFLVCWKRTRYSTISYRRNCSTEESSAVSPYLVTRCLYRGRRIVLLDAEERVVSGDNFSDGILPC